MVKTQSPVTHWDENVKCMRSSLPVETGVSLLFLFLMRVYAFQSLLSIRRDEWSSMVRSIRRSEASFILTTALNQRAPMRCSDLPQAPLLWSSMQLSFTKPLPFLQRAGCFSPPRVPGMWGSTSSPSWFLFFDYFRSTSRSSMYGP